MTGHQPGQPGTFFRRPPTRSLADHARAEFYGLYFRLRLLPLADEVLSPEVERLGQSFDDIAFLNLAAELLEMASELLAKGHTDPAAVISGALLTDHVHRLALRHGVPLVVDGRPKRAETLNADLVNVRAYNGLMGENVASCLQLTDDALHEREHRYDAQQVLMMMVNVRMYIQWTLPTGAVEQSALRSEPKVTKDMPPTEWFDAPRGERTQAAQNAESADSGRSEPPS